MQIAVKREHKKKKNLIYMFGIIVLSVLIINIISRLSTPFCDFYLKHITPIWTNTFGRVMSVFPFSLGEIFVILMCIFPIFAAVFLIISGIKKKNFTKRATLILKIFCFILSYLLITSTFGASILYHCSTVSDKMGYVQKEYTQTQLLDMYNDYVKIANELSEKVRRDENGKFLMTESDREDCRKAINNISDKLPELKGYVPKAKPVMFSDVMGIMSISGVFFPFTYESNYNKNMDDISQPATLCHELAHAKGFLLEDEANFIGFYACINSDNINLQYGGYIDIIEEIYISDSTAQQSIDSWSEQLRKDIAADFQYWNEVDDTFADKTIINVKTVNVLDEISNKVTDTSLKFNDVSDGINSYGRIIDLALAEYYDDKKS